MTSGGLKSHLLTHDDNTTEVPRIKCECCPSTFKSASGLRLHMVIHQTFSDKLQCPHCPEKLSNKHTLNRHISNRHKEHNCNFCGRTFNRLEQLKVRNSIIILRPLSTEFDRFYSYAAPFGIT